jgi:signal transduction histidine kinase
MGNFLRLVILIITLGALAAGLGSLLLQESQRERYLERLALSSQPSTPGELVAALRKSHSLTQRHLLMFGGLTLVCVLALAVAPGRKPSTPPDGDPLNARSEMRGLETLARATNAQRAELLQEREARHLSEQDLHLQQVLANRALEDKVRLGRDLHDGLVQTLYATGLVLEAASQRLSAAPVSPAASAEITEAAKLLERAKTTLNAAIRDARGTIGGLTPGALDEETFSANVHTILDHLDGGRLRERLVNLDPALPVFPEPHRTELLQIIREAASNSLRHGAATRLELTFSPLFDGRLQLVLRDNGNGFDPAAVTRGHGLDNLAARARTLAGMLDIGSSPGRGTAITLTLPAPARGVSGR